MNTLLTGRIASRSVLFQGTVSAEENVATEKSAQRSTVDRDAPESGNLTSAGKAAVMA